MVFSLSQSPTNLLELLLSGTMEWATVSEPSFIKPDGKVTRFLFVFLDGVGLGANDAAINPLARAPMPNLVQLLGSRRLLADAVPLETDRASVVPLDACLGIGGTPQSASGQATLLTGRNVPAFLGQHYGPWPSPAVVELLDNGNLFRILETSGHRTALLNAYPPSYFAAIESRRRLYSAIPQAVVSAGLSLKTAADLNAGRALAADFTGFGWRERLGLAETPLLTPEQAGRRLAREALSEHDFSFFEYWLTDYAGHARDMVAACDLLSTFDRVLAGLLPAWDDEAGLVLVTSDHGNIEDLSMRGHTTNPVPALLIGARAHRRAFARSLHDLTDIVPAILRFLQ
jgi:2,3-bisphosphoglycerate-independent phosphoglycerate mutase